MLLGRDRELSALGDVVAAARAGNGGSVVVHGAPGIGKTALVDALVEASRLRTLRACGYESEADLAFATLGDLLRPVLDHVVQLSPAQADAVTSAFGLERHAGFDASTIEVATANLLRAVARRAPLLVVVDDVPWADTGSQSAILHLARRAATFSVAVVLVARTEDMTESMADLPCLEVAPLSTAHAAALVRDRGPEVTPAVLDVLVERGRGNPLALHELVAGLTIEQRSGRADLDDPIPVAAEVVLAYRRRIDRLPATTRQALLLAVVEGRGNLVAVTKALEASSSSLAAFEPAESDRLVVLEDGFVQFRHPLVRSVVHQTAAPAERRAAHAVLATIDQDPDRRAWHLGSSVAGPAPEAAAAMREMGDRALERGADATAARALTRAAELTAPASEQGRLYARAARAANRGGDQPLAAHLLSLAEPLLGDDPLARADLTVLEADLRIRRGDLLGAYLDLGRQAEAVAPIDRRRAMVMLLFSAKLHVYRMEAAEGVRAVRRALELTGGEAPDLLQIAALSMVDAMAGGPHALDTTRSALHAAMSVTRGHLHAQAIAWPLVWLDEHEDARRFLNWSIAAQREGGYHSYLPQSLLPSAELDLRGGRLVQAHDERDGSAAAVHRDQSIDRCDAGRGNDCPHRSGAR